MSFFSVVFLSETIEPLFLAINTPVNDFRPYLNEKQGYYFDVKCNFATSDYVSGAMMQQI